MNPLFEKNIALLKEKRPSLFKLLEEQIQQFKNEGFGKSHPFLQWTEADGHPNLALSINGNSFLYHRPNPVTEAQNLLEKVRPGDATMVFVLGNGLGFLLKEFLKRRTNLNYVIAVFEHDPQIFLRSLCVNDFEKEFEDTSISFFVTSEYHSAASGVHHFMRVNSSADTNIKLLYTETAVNFAMDYYKRLADEIPNCRAEMRVIFGNSIEDSLFGLSNIADNLPMSLASKGIAPLISRFVGQDKAVLSIATGPSLNEHFDTLREWNGRIPMIACDSALKSLLEHGIVPDFVVALEREPIVAECFRGLQIPERLALIGPPVLLKCAYDAFEGERLVFHSAGNPYDIVTPKALGSISAGHSAGTLNAILCARMGFKKIIMIGHNLAWDPVTGQQHVDGTPIASQDRPQSVEELEAVSHGVKVPTQDGTGMVYSHYIWNLFRSQIERLIVETGENHIWVNTALKGSLIRGTETLTLKEALSKYVDSDFDINPIVKEVLVVPTPEEVRLRAQSIQDLVQRSLDRIAYWQEQTRNLLSQMAKWRKKIEEKELKGSRIGIEFLVSCLNELLAFKVESMEQDHVFRNSGLELTMPFHMVFERELNDMPRTYKDNYLLKRDFLFRHEKYFSEVWTRHFPEILATYRKLLEASTRILASN